MKRVFALAQFFAIKLAETDSDLQSFISQIKETGKASYNGFTFRHNEASYHGIRGEYATTTLIIDKQIYGALDFNLETNTIEIFLKGEQDEYLPKTSTETAIATSMTDIQRMSEVLNNHKGKTNNLLGISFATANLAKDLDLGFFDHLTRNSDLIGYLRENIPHVVPELGSKIGSGAEGEVFEYGKDSIIKIMLTDSQKKDDIFRMLSHLQGLKEHKCTTNIYDFGDLARIGRFDLLDNALYHDAYWVIYYVAERAYPINPEEFSKADLAELMNCLSKIGIKAEDVVNNIDNIMQTKDGRYVMVDYGDFTRLAQ